MRALLSETSLLVRSARSLTRPSHGGPVSYRSTLDGLNYGKAIGLGPVKILSPYFGRPLSTYYNDAGHCFSPP